LLGRPTLLHWCVVQSATTRLSSVHDRRRHYNTQRTFPAVILPGCSAHGSFAGADFWPVGCSTVTRNVRPFVSATFRFLHFDCPSRLGVYRLPIVPRDNRRHKLPRRLARVQVTFRPFGRQHSRPLNGSTPLV